jgi:LEA14-like dessication related protein
MRKLGLLLVAGLLLQACALHAPEMRGGESFEFGKMDGQTITFTAGAKVYNENWFGIKVKPSNLILIVDGDEMGSVRLDKKVKLKRKQETELNAPFTATLKEGTKMKLLALAAKGEVKVRLKGKLKAGVFIFSKKIDFDETKTISTSKLLP